MNIYEIPATTLQKRNSPPGLRFKGRDATVYRNPFIRTVAKFALLRRSDVKVYVNRALVYMHMMSIITLHISRVATAAHW